MAKTSAGILTYRRQNGVLHVLLVHPGGPLWAKKDLGAWSIPKGECEPGEDPLAVAKREFEEETSFQASGSFLSLSPIKSGGKLIQVWACEGDYDAAAIKSNLFAMEWPPRSGKQKEFPEVDCAAWFSIATAKRKIIQGQRGFLDELCALLGETVSEESQSALTRE